MFGSAEQSSKIRIEQECGVDQISHDLIERQTRLKRLYVQPYLFS